MIEAGFSDVCACGAPITEGDTVGEIDGELVCLECVESLGEDELDAEAMFGGR